MGRGLIPRGTRGTGAGLRGQHALPRRPPPPSPRVSPRPEVPCRAWAGGLYLPKAGLMKAGWRNTAAPRKVPRPSGVPPGGSAAEPGGGGGRLGKAAAAAAAAAAVQAESRAG